eukprot:487521-Rhodomonas_salina.2
MFLYASSKLLRDLCRRVVSCYAMFLYASGYAPTRSENVSGKLLPHVCADVPRCSAISGCVAQDTTRSVSARVQCDAEH